MDPQQEKEAPPAGRTNEASPANGKAPASAPQQQPRQPISRRASRIGAVVAVLATAGLGWLAWDLTHPAAGTGPAAGVAGPNPGLGPAAGVASGSARAAAGPNASGPPGAPSGPGAGSAGASPSPGPGSRRGPPPTTVGIAVAERANVPVLLDALGTVTPQAAVRVRPQVTGVLEKVLFSEGQMVRAGQLLAIIDPRQFELALQQAQGQRQRDEAQLDSARAMLERFKTLMSQDSIARQDLDTQAALVKQLEGTLLIDKANEGIARLNLSYTRVVAPVGGRVGLRAVDVGNVVSPSDANGIALITQLAPIDVVFAIPQDQAGGLQKSLSSRGNLPNTQANVRTHANARQGTPAGRAAPASAAASAAAGASAVAPGIKVTALDRARAVALDTGVLASLDNQVDTQTGTVKAKARFANANLALFPNQFVNVQVLIDTVENAVVVPVTAVRRGSSGDYAYVVNMQERTVSLRPVTRGQANAEKVVVTAGLKAGERVITEGADRLKDGASVTLPSDQARPPGVSASGSRRDGPRDGSGNRQRPENAASAAAGVAPGTAADGATRPQRRPPEAVATPGAAPASAP